MQPNDVTELLLYGEKLWPQKFPLPQEEADLALTLRAWERQLGDLEQPLVMAAMDLWRGHWPPTPSELRDASLQLQAEVMDRRIPDGDQAWLEFTTDYRMDYGGEHEWSHPVVAEAARALGCREYGQSETADLATWRAQFRGFYEAARARYERTGAAVPPGAALWREQAVAELAKKLHMAELESGE
jgi:hypothetical protein